MPVDFTLQLQLLNKLQQQDLQMLVELPETTFVKLDTYYTGGTTLNLIPLAQWCRKQKERGC